MSYPLRSSFFKSPDNCLLTVKVFKRDVQVKFSSFNRLSFISEPEKEKRKSKRSKIIGFSKRSARRLRHVVRNSEDTWKAFITLTYPENFPCDGRKAKAHLNAFLQWLRSRNIKYVWVLEFQLRGAPHYHILVSEYIPKAGLSKRWYKIVGSGDEKHLKAGTQIQSIKSKRHLYGYLSSYINKLVQKILPVQFENVGRFWGASRNLLVFELYQKLGHYFNLVRNIKLLRNWYKAHLRKFNIKWKWKGQGFTALDGVSFINQLLTYRC